MDILDLSVGEKKNKRKGVAPQRQPSDITDDNDSTNMMQQVEGSNLPQSMKLMGKIFEAVQKQNETAAANNFVERRSPISVYEGSRLNTSDDDSTEVSSVSSHKQCDLNRAGKWLNKKIIICLLLAY